MAEKGDAESTEAVAAGAGGRRRQQPAGRGRVGRLAVCVAGALAACAAVACLVPHGGDGAARRGGELLGAGTASNPTRRDMFAALRAGPHGEGAMIKEQASEEINRREGVAMQAETLRTALRAMGKEAPSDARAQLANAEAALRKGAEGGSTAGLAALQGARAVLTQVVGEEAARDSASMARSARAVGAARTQSLTSDQLSVPAATHAWRERYMERYAACWPHCAPEANVMNTIDPSKYPYNEETGGHKWTSWRIGHSGVNAAYAQAEHKYYDEGRRVREAANAEAGGAAGAGQGRLYPNTYGPAYKASHGASSTSLLGHAPTSRDESRAAYDREVDSEWRRREREAHPYRPLQEGERGTLGGSRYADERRSAAPRWEEQRDESARAERPRRQAMQQMDDQGRVRGTPERETGSYQWTGKGGVQETNVWSTPYLRSTSDQYYGSRSGHTWAWRDDSTRPDGYYYNVLTAPEAQADAEEIVNGGPAPSPAAAAADAAAIVTGGAAPAEAAATQNVSESNVTAAVSGSDTASSNGMSSVQARAGFDAVHQLAAKKMAQKSFWGEAEPVKWGKLEERQWQTNADSSHVTQERQWLTTQQLPKAAATARQARANQQRLAVQDAAPAPALEPSENVALSKIGINAGDSLGSYGDVRVKAPGGGVSIGQIFRVAGPKWTQKLAMTPMHSYPYKPTPLPSSYYASAAVGAETPVNTSPDLPQVTFIAAPYGGSAEVTMPVYTRTPQNPWVHPALKITAAERAKLSAATARKAAAAAAGAAAFSKPSAAVAAPANSTGAASGVAAAAPAGTDGAASGAAAAAEGEASTAAAKKVVGGLAKAGLAMTSIGASTALSLGQDARNEPHSVNSIIAKPMPGAAGSARARGAGTSTPPSLRTSALEARRDQRQMMVAGFMAEQEASRMTVQILTSTNSQIPIVSLKRKCARALTCENFFQDRPPQPVIGLGKDSFVLSIPSTSASTELASPPALPSTSSKTGDHNVLHGPLDVGLQEKSSPGL